ncbi:carbon-nitrogen hydrolase family protein [Chondrinema litorale]|uniref:carbon-nitrogen hydrolase family protein n=1 Tax=Chondrinema litorale TaxID=2994555 RepID=UPI002542C21F|nr:carbon-nitrogen hydrolase family protein [Chondrinema litorale]UZR97840.1 carbon-nitrogen hydrolase family protein [Chondrinema litorale]
MKLCVAQLASKKGDILENISRHIKMINSAVTQGAELIIFPELSLTGYEPKLAKALATSQDNKMLGEFQQLSDQHQITIGLGLPTKYSESICISMVIFQPNQSRLTYSKKYIHTDEEPYFVCGKNFPVLKLKGKNIAIAICYELSIPAHAEAAYNNGADVYIASVAKTETGIAKAHETLCAIAKKYNFPVLISNSVGPSEDFISAGNSAIWDKNGILQANLDAVEEGLLLFNLDD